MKPCLMLIGAAVIGSTLCANASRSNDSISTLDPAGVVNAQSAAEHEGFAKAFEAEAAALEKKVAFHQNLADTYGIPGGKSVQASIARHCRELAAEYRAAAEGNRQLALEQRALAQAAGK